MLKSEGFRKKGTTWNRHNNDIVEVIDIQKGRIKKDGSVDFTVNIGLWIEDVWKLCWDKPTLKFVKEEDCFPRFRIGFLLDNYNTKFIDKWWVLTEEDMLFSGEQIQSVINQEVLPFYKKCNNMSDVLSFVGSNISIRLPLEYIYLAILRYISGQRDASVQILHEFINDKHWGMKAKDVLKRLQDLQ
jgi:hypothetical protein